MKNLIIILAISLIFSCSNSSKYQKTNGEVEVENGMGQKVKIPYSILYVNAIDSANRMTFEYFNKIVSTASASAKSKCKFKPTYDPVRIDLFLYKGFNADSIYKDSITTEIKFRAKNAFGVPDDMMLLSNFKGIIETANF